MKVTLEIHEKYRSPEVHVCADRDDREIRKIYDAVLQAVDARLAAYQGREAVMVSCAELVRIYTQNKKVYCATETQLFQLRERLYELEEKLDMTQFIRISSSEIVNMQKILHLDASLSGTIRMYLQGGTETYVSRRYVSRIRKALGI